MRTMDHRGLITPLRFINSRAWSEVVRCSALPLRGFAAEPVTAAWLLSWCFPATWPAPSRGRPLCHGVPGDRRHGRVRPTSSRPATGARLRHSRQKKPRSGEGRGFRTGDPPWGEGKMIALSTSTVPNDPQFLGPLTPSSLVRAANPRHDPRGALNAKP